jgi:hypothetical protein
MNVRLARLFLPLLTLLSLGLPFPFDALFSIVSLFCPFFFPVCLVVVRDKSVRRLSTLKLSFSNHLSISV